MKGYSKMFQDLLYGTPTPSSISFNWNFGSLLLICLVVQLVSGFFLALHYHSSIAGAFLSVSVAMDEELWYGWAIRSAHANGASFFFIFIYLHIARGLFFSSFLMMKTWLVGVILLFILMATAFLGYVLPWGQMSLWGATVITNLLSAIPFVGKSMVEWVWGGFSVSEPTLERFFSIHFILPFILAFFVLSHILLLHETGSSNTLGVDNNSDKIMFHPYFTIKDLLGVIFFSIIFSWLSVQKWDFFMDPDNFTLANPLVTPAHIQPEWYFLFAYAILRSIPNKLGGVIGLVLSILALSTFSFKKTKLIYSKPIVCLFFVSFMVLSWLGGMEVDYPFVGLSQCFATAYFSLILTLLWV